MKSLVEVAFIAAASLPNRTEGHSIKEIKIISLALSFTALSLVSEAGDIIMRTKTMWMQSSIARTICPETMAWRLRTACAVRLLPLALLLALPSSVSSYLYAVGFHGPLPGLTIQ